jgi:hypothetical protein
MSQILIVVLFLTILIPTIAVTKTQTSENQLTFPIIEFRRYTIKEGERENFGHYFESYFPEAFQQLGAIAFGQFLERDNSSNFAWLRGFQNYEARATVNTAFYSGPVWKEHAKTMNNRIVDIGNVLLLHPLNPEKALKILPAVDPIKETNGAEGIVVAQIFAMKVNSVDDFTNKAETMFAAYREAGIREAGVLVTLDVENNFPGLPFRTDGPFLVWFGIVKDNEMLETKLKPIAKKFSEALNGSGLLKNLPELVIMDPTSRSRLRWIPQ